jgi:hypothetical protein
VLGLRLGFRSATLQAPAIVNRAFSVNTNNGRTCLTEEEPGADGNRILGGVGGVRVCECASVRVPPRLEKEKGNVREKNSMDWR